MELKFWPLEGHPRLMATPDAAFRNNSDKSSQRAMVIFISEPRKEKSRNFRGPLIFFESTKMKRTTLSTTVAELYALMKCYGTCQMLRGLIKDITGHSRELHMRTDANNLVTTASATHIPEQQETIHMIQMLRKEACSGSIADLSHIRTQWCLADCLTKKSANPQALIDAVRQGILKEVDAHPPFRTLVEHKAYLRSWLPTVCHHVNFALDVFFLGERFHWQMCAVNLFACWHFSVVCDECCLTVHECHVERNFHFFLWICACGSISLYSSLVFVVFVVFVFGSVLSTKKDGYLWLWFSCRCSSWTGVQEVFFWYQERTFARTERRCIKVYQRANDMSHEDTLHALENMISLIVFSEHSYRFGVYKQWEADFLRHLLGYTTFEEERDFNDGCTLNFRLCDDHNSVEMSIGKKLAALLRHNSPLKNYMYPICAVELSHVLDHCGKPVNAFEQFKFGRYFAAFIQGNNKQRYFVEVELKDDWFLSTDRLPWKIFIGCN